MNYLTALMGVAVGLLIRSVIDDTAAITFISFGLGGACVLGLYWVTKVME
jgi:hypothetical protein